METLIKTVKTGMYKESPVKVTITVTYDDTTVFKVSFVGECFNYGSGQISEILVDDDYVTDPDVDSFAVYTLWRAYHANDMHAGNDAQRLALARRFVDGKYTHDEAVEHLKSVDKYVVDGYRYGSGWCTKHVPYGFIDWVKGLPDV